MSVITLGNFEFAFVCKLEVERDAVGEIVQYLPQERYYAATSTPLNRYGQGPFIKFKIPRDMSQGGVYILTVDRQPKYVGETANLSKRYNMGYGNISPRNCFKGGQETNCRLNHAIYLEVRMGRVLELWFFPTTEYKAVELELRADHKLEWNRQ